jgi:hypothetical protein
MQAHQSRREKYDPESSTVPSQPLISTYLLTDLPITTNYTNSHAPTVDTRFQRSLCIRYQKLSAADFAAHRARIAAGSFTPGQLVTLAPDLKRDRFDEYVSEALLQAAFVSEVLDLSSTHAAAGESIIQ